MNTIIKIGLIGLLLMFSLKINAQDNSLVEVGNDVINEENLIAGEQVYEYVRHQGDKKSVFGKIYERINQDKNRWVIEYFQDLPQMNLTDSLVLSKGTLSPVRYRSHVPERQDIVVNYENNTKIEGHFYQNLPGSQIDSTFTTKFETLNYDGHWVHPLLYALDKKAGRTISLPIFTYRGGISRLDVSIMKHERVTLHGKEYQTWKISVSRESSGNTSYYWIDRASNRLVQSRTELPNELIFIMRRTS